MRNLCGFVRPAMLVMLAASGCAPTASAPKQQVVEVEAIEPAPTDAKAAETTLHAKAVIDAAAAATKKIDDAKAAADKAITEAGQSIDPPAPGTFSMTTGWPHASLSFWPMARARMSVDPPGVKGTTSRIGLAG